VVLRARLLLDYVSGMTDTYALEEFRLLSGI
jgi:dGTPase